ncbi:hypothetical protein [Neptunicella sp. SCSIO 80796]|uniref:hypothetical protein n=1 Tax=Neptunicella plasticusilytica TaxID=3117012 RepID=UPI003A4DF555
MQLTSLNIIIISESLSRRQQIARQLYAYGVTKVTDTDQVSPLFEPGKTEYDVIVLDRQLSNWQTRAELVRYLTYARLVPAWCTFVLVCDDSLKEQGMLPFRHIDSQTITSELTTSNLMPSLVFASKGITELRSLINIVESAQQRQVLESLKQARTRQLPVEIQSSLEIIVIRTLFLNGHSHFAFKQAEKIRDPKLRHSAKLLMSFLMGDKLLFSQCMQHADSTPGLEPKILYYKAMMCVQQKNYRGAKNCCQQMPEWAKSASLSQTLVLLELMIEGFDQAMDYLQQQRSDGQELEPAHHLLQFSGFMLLVLSLMKGRKASRTQAIERFALAEFIGFNTLQNSPDQLGTLTPYLHLLAHILLEQQSSKQLHQELQSLVAKTEPFNALKWLLLAASAVGLKQYQQALDLLVKVDAALSPMEPCAELVFYEVVWQILFDLVVDAENTTLTAINIGAELKKQGVNYRALKRLYSARQLEPSNVRCNLLLLELMKRLSLVQYSELHQDTVQAALESSRLSDSQGQQLDKISEIEPAS